MQRVTATAEGQVQANVDDLFRFELGLQNPRTYSGADRAQGWEADTFRGLSRLSAFAATGGKRGAFVRFPDKQLAIIVLTNDDSADAKGIAEKIAERLLPK
jgi:hypothetical protein